jgi:O-antigen/teichoic acid export membrane protein
LRSRLLSGGKWALAGRVTNVILGLAVSALVARLLTPADMGSYFLGLSVVTVASMAARMGLENTVVKLVAENLALARLTEARRVLRPVYVLATVGAITVGALMSGMLGRWVATVIFGSEALGRVVVLLGLWAVALTYQILLAETFRGLHDIRLATLLGPAAPGLLSVAIFAGLRILLGQTTLSTVVAVSVSAVVSTTAAATLILWRILPKLHGGPELGTNVGAVFRESWPLLLTNTAAIVATQADLWIIGAYREELDVALYGAAARLALLVGVSLTIANQVLPPVIAELNTANAKGRLQRVLQVSAAGAAMPAAVAFSVFLLAGGLVLELTFGPEYRAAALILAILSIGRCVGVWVGACEFTLIMTGHQRVLATAAVLTSIAVVGGSLLVVGPFGPLGVAAVTSLSIGLQQLGLLLLAHAYSGVWTHARLDLLLQALGPQRQRPSP